MDSQFITFQIQLPNILFLATTFYISVTGTHNEAGPISQAPTLWMPTASGSGSTSHPVIPNAADISLPVQRQAGDKTTVPTKRAPSEGVNDCSLGGKMATEGEGPSLTMTANESDTNNSQTMSAIESQIFKKLQIPKKAPIFHVRREIKNRKETTIHTTTHTTKPTGNVADSQLMAASGMMSNLSRFMTYRSKRTRSLARTSDGDSRDQSQTIPTFEVSASNMVADGTSSHLQSRTIWKSVHEKAGDTPWTQTHATETTSETATHWKSQDDQWSVIGSGPENQVKAENAPTSFLEMSSAAGTLVTSAVSSKKNITLPAQEADLTTPESQPTHYMAKLHVAFQVRPADTGEDSHISILLEQLCLLLLSQFTFEDVELRWTPEEKVYFIMRPEDSNTDQFIHLEQLKNKCKRHNMVEIILAKVEMFQLQGSKRFPQSFTEEDTLEKLQSQRARLDP